MKKTALLVLFAMTCAVGFAQITAFRKQVENGYNFWLYTPPGSADAQSGCPVIVFLHGQSLCGRDLNAVRRYGCINAVERGMKIDAMILAPQNPGGAWNPRKIKNILDWVQANYKTDTTRVYVVGMSLGGFGTMDFAGTYPETVAAAVALCGGCTLSSFEGLAHVPLWIMHGTADRAVSYQEAERVQDRIRKEGGGGLLRCELMSGLDHGALARTFYIPELYDWLFLHSTADSLRRVDETVVINASTLKQAYKSIARNAPKVRVLDAAADSKTTVAAADNAKDKPAENATVHVVRQGDTLGALARKYRTSVAVLCQLNRIKSASVLRLGQQIVVR